MARITAIFLSTTFVNILDLNAVLLFPFSLMTGCDYTSAFKNFVKKTAWKIWDDMPREIKMAVKLVIKVYSRNCEVESVNETHELMLISGLKSLDHISPAKHVRFQPQKRSVLVSVFYGGDIFRCITFLA